MSKKKFAIEVLKTIGHGDMPPYLGLFHRHFEKAQPAVASDVSATVNAPVDLLDLMLPHKILGEIESIDILYRK